MKNIISAISESLKNNSPVVLVTVIASSGSTPRGSGATMLVYEDGRSIGTIGGGNVEFEAQKYAVELFKKKTSETKGYCLNKNDVANLGMICGGNVTVYFQYLSGKEKELFEYLLNAFNKNQNTWLVRKIENDTVTAMGVYDDDGMHFTDNINLNEVKPLLKASGMLKKGEPAYYCEPIVKAGVTYIFGGGHVAQKLVPVLTTLGFSCIVYEDRDCFTDISLFPGAIKTVLGDFKRLSDNITITKNDYVIIMTRGHQTDFELLEQTLRTPATYIGCIGSRHKIALTKQRLAEAGIPEEEYDKRVHSPIGLEIGAQTPEEIAISIAAELILHRSKQNG